MLYTVHLCDFQILYNCGLQCGQSICDLTLAPGQSDNDTVSNCKLELISPCDLSV